MPMIHHPSIDDEIIFFNVWTVDTRSGSLHSSLVDEGSSHGSSSFQLKEIVTAYVEDGSIEK